MIRMATSWMVFGAAGLLAGAFAVCKTTPGNFLSTPPNRDDSRIAESKPTVPSIPSMPADDFQPPSTTQDFQGEAMSISRETRGVTHADEASFQREVLQSDVPVLVDFYADWCGPCRALAPILEEFAEESSGSKVVKVNVDDSPSLATRYGISSIPSLLVFKNGEVVAEHVGLANKAHLRRLVTR